MLTSLFNIIISFYKQYKSFRKFSRLSEQEKNASFIPKDFVKRVLSLGPTFIKLGQVLSTRPDILPPQYISALELLQEHVPPFDFTQVKKIIEQERDAPLEEIYKSFETQPVASASLSQVHFAILKSGEEVAVKIRRPKVKEQIQSDLKLLGRIISMAGFFKPKMLKNLNLQTLFREFKRYSLQELDFSNEGSVYDRFKQNFQENPQVIFPKVYWEYTTESVLTMERVSGLRLNQVRDTMDPESRNKLANAVIETLIHMFVCDGFFHADMHPGNIFFGEDGTIKLIDVGMYGELNNEQRDRFILYWLAVVLKEKKRAFYHLVQLLESTPEADEAAFYLFYEDLLDKFYASTVRERSLTQTYMEIVMAATRYGFVPSSEMLLQAKALTTAENLAFVLAPEFNFADATKPVITKAFAKRSNIENLIQRFTGSFPKWLLLGETGGSTPSDPDNSNNYLWQEMSKELAFQWDDFHGGNFKEFRHGEYSVEINMPVEVVFNFVTRLSQYPLWHPIYTPESKVIHVSGEYVFITPEVIGSVFRIDEIVDGYHLLSNGVIVEFEQNRFMKWKAPFAMFPVISLGTCLQLDVIDKSKTRITEYFYLSDSPLQGILINRKGFSKKALTHHIREELTGVKNILESGNFSEEDVSYLWKDLRHPTRFLDGNWYEIEHVNGGPMSKLIE
jgi:predicted unusual protein kinase regulating ubiquinone biosynthesis (AarF/ABC1/UbiB family)